MLGVQKDEGDGHTNGALPEGHDVYRPPRPYGDPTLHQKVWHVATHLLVNVAACALDAIETPTLYMYIYIILFCVSLFLLFS